MKKFSEFLESKNNYHVCPKCGRHNMVKHPNKEKAKKGYKICPEPKCNTVYSPEAPKFKNSWADKVKSEN